MIVSFSAIEGWLSNPELTPCTLCVYQIAGRKSVLEEYHKVNPLTADELRFLKEGYRFFILNYVIKDGSHFFSEQYAKKLRAEAYDIYLPSVDRDFDAEKLIKALKIKDTKPVKK